MPTLAPLEQRHSARFATRVSRRIGQGTQNVLATLAHLRDRGFEKAPALQRAHERLDRFAARRDDVAATNLAALGGVALSIAGVIIGAVVAVTLISSLLPTYAGGVKNISSNLTTADWGNATANGIGPVFAMVVSLAGMFALVGLALVAFHLRHKSG